jgi:hypothetical protein
LFGGLYVNVDIINAHPAILYDYAVTRGIAVGSLGELANDREVFYEKVSGECGNSTRTPPKKLALITLNTDEIKLKSKSLDGLTFDMRAIRNRLYEEFYLGDSEFRSAIDVRCEGVREPDILRKTQSLFCFNRETECIMSFRDFYLKTIDPELRDCSSFIPFYDGWYIHTDTISSLDVSSMQSIHIRADIEDIISKYNSINTIRFKCKSIEIEDTLIPREVYNDIQCAIDLVEQMSGKEIIDEFKTLEVDDRLIKPLHDIIDSQPREFVFDYDQITSLQREVKFLYHELIRDLITRKKSDLHTNPT